MSEAEAYLRSRRPPTAPDTTFAKFLQVADNEHEPDELQHAVDEVWARINHVNYEHLWFAWELLRRSPYWRVAVWWQGGVDGLGATDRRLVTAFRKIVGPQKLERLYAPIPPTDPVRSHRFPDPVHDGTCPAARAHEGRVLWLLLRRLTDVPVFVDFAYPLDRPERSPSIRSGEVAVLLNLRARDSTIVAVLQALREVRQVTVPNSGPRARDVWGRSELPRAIDAIAFVNHVESGGDLADWRRPARETPDDRRLRVRLLSRRVESLAAMIRGNPLTSICPTAAPSELARAARQARPTAPQRTPPTDR